MADKRNTDTRPLGIHFSCMCISLEIFNVLPLSFNDAQGCRWRLPCTPHLFVLEFVRLKKHTPANETAECSPGNKIELGILIQRPFVFAFLDLVRFVTSWIIGRENVLFKAKYKERSGCICFSKSYF